MWVRVGGRLHLAKTDFQTVWFAKHTCRIVFGVSETDFQTVQFADNTFRMVSGFSKIDFVTRGKGGKFHRGQKQFHGGRGEKFHHGRN